MVESHSQGGSAGLEREWIYEYKTRKSSNPSYPNRNFSVNLGVLNKNFLEGVWSIISKQESLSEFVSTKQERAVIDSLQTGLFKYV